MTGPLVEAEECPQLTHHGFTKLEPNAPPSEAPRCIQHDGALPSSSSCALVVPERLVSTFSVPRTLRAVSMEGGDQPGLPAKSSWSLQRETRQSWMETVPRGSCSKDPSPQTEQGVGNALLIPEPLMSPFEVSMQNGPDTHWHASPVSSSSPKAQPTSQQKAEQLGIPSNMSQSPCSPAPSLLAESLLVPTLRDSEIRVKQKLGAGSFGSVGRGPLCPPCASVSGWPRITTDCLLSHCCRCF